MLMYAIRQPLIKMATEFTPAKDIHLETIKSIARRTVDRSYRSFLEASQVEHYLESGDLEQYLTKYIHHTWILSQETEIVGFSICIENIIDFMLIDVKFHRQGLGAQLLQECESLLFKGHETLALESFERNTHANNFFIANRWEKLARHKDPKTRAFKFIFIKHAFSKPYG